MVRGMSKSANLLVEIGSRGVVESEFSTIFRISSGTSKFWLVIKVLKDVMGAAPSDQPPPPARLARANALMPPIANFEKCGGVAI